MAIAIVICATLLVLVALAVWNNYLQTKAKARGSDTGPVSSTGSSALDE